MLYKHVIAVITHIDRRTPEFGKVTAAPANSLEFCVSLGLGPSSGEHLSELTSDFTLMLSAAMPAAQTLPTSNFWADHTSLFLFLWCWAKSQSGTLPAKRFLCAAGAVQPPGPSSQLRALLVQNKSHQSVEFHSWSQLPGLAQAPGQKLSPYQVHWACYPATQVTATVGFQKCAHGGVNQCSGGNTGREELGNASTFVRKTPSVILIKSYLQASVKPGWLELASHLILYSDMKCHRELPTQLQAILCRNTTCTFPVLNFLLHNCPKLWLNTKQAGFALLCLRNELPISRVLLAAGITTFAVMGTHRTAEPSAEWPRCSCSAHRQGTRRGAAGNPAECGGRGLAEMRIYSHSLKNEKVFPGGSMSTEIPQGLLPRGSSSGSPEKPRLFCRSLRESPRPSRLHKISPDPQFPRGSQTCYYFPVEVASLSIILKEKNQKSLLIHIYNY